MAKKILVVDDEAELVDMVKIRLETNGYEVITACDGKEGVEKAMCQHPDLILLDLMMPVMDGFEALRCLKAEQSTSRIPVIVFTARGDTKSVLEAEDLKATDYIIKPFEPKELLKLVRGYIAKNS